jgi:hypothetical protein
VQNVLARSVVNYCRSLVCMLSNPDRVKVSTPQEYHEPCIPIAQADGERERTVLPATSPAPWGSSGAPNSANPGELQERHGPLPTHRLDPRAPRVRDVVHSHAQGDLPEQAAAPHGGAARPHRPGHVAP